MSGRLVLSVFPGIDLLGRAFEEEGFCVVRGPDLIFGGDIRAFHPPTGVFDGIIGGPPCQCFSILKRLNPHAGEKHGNLIPEFERIVAEARPRWFLMENVTTAPLPSVLGYVSQPFILNNRWVGGVQERQRLFVFGTPGGRCLQVDIVALEAGESSPAVTGNARAVPVRIGGSGKPKRSLAPNGAPHGPCLGPMRTVAEMLVLQDYPADLLDEVPFTVKGKRQVIANGVPRRMGLAVARGVKQAGEVAG